jgi:hypothetical protein
MESQDFIIDSDGWCLYNAYLTVFGPYQSSYTSGSTAKTQRTKRAITLATRLGEIATEEDKAFIRAHLTDPEYDALPVLDANGSPTGSYGYPSQLLAVDRGNYVEVSGSRRRFITDVDEFLTAIRTPIFDRTGIQPTAWGSITLLRPLFIRFRPDVYFDVRVRDSDGEANANTGRALLGQEELKYLGPNGERNLSLISSGNHYNSRVYITVDEDPFATVDEDSELMAATLGSLLIGAAGSALDPAVKTGSIKRIQRLASSLPAIREETNQNIEAENDIPYAPRAPVPQPGAAKRIRNLDASLKADPVAYNRQLNVARARSLDKPTARLTAEQEGPASRAIRRVGRAIAATVPEPGGVEYVSQTVPSVSGLFPRITMPSFDSTTIPQPRHRRRHPYRRFVAPPAPPSPAVVGPQQPRSTEIPAWAAQHISQANVAANVKGVAAAVVDDVLAMQDYRGVNADAAYAAYKADPKTRGLDSSGGDPVHWDELVERYPDRNVLIRDGSGDIHRFRVSNPYRAAGYRRKTTFSFGDPAGLNPQQAAMAQQNLDVLTEIAPDEMIADTKYATALLESLWYCGAAKDIGADPRCFPARVLGELREYKLYKEERARAALAAKAQQYSEWGFIKGVLRKVRGQISGSDKAAGPVVISGIPAEAAAGPNLSISTTAKEAAPSLAARIAAAGVVEEEEVKPPDIPRPITVPRPLTSGSIRIGDIMSVGSGPEPKRKIPKIARVALASPPQTLGAIGLRPLPPPAVLGAWGSRFRPIIPGI